MVGTVPWWPLSQLVAGTALTGLGKFRPEAAAAPALAAGQPLCVRSFLESAAELCVCEEQVELQSLSVFRKCSRC